MGHPCGVAVPLAHADDFAQFDQGERKRILLRVHIHEEDSSVVLSIPVGTSAITPIAGIVLVAVTGMSWLPTPMFRTLSDTLTLRRILAPGMRQRDRKLSQSLRGTAVAASKGATVIITLHQTRTTGAEGDGARWFRADSST